MCSGPRFGGVLPDGRGVLAASWPVEWPTPALARAPAARLQMATQVVLDDVACHKGLASDTEAGEDNTHAESASS